MLYKVTVEKVKEGYKILPTNHVAKDQRETELWVRANFRVNPDEWAAMKADLDRMGNASIERSFARPA